MIERYINLCDDGENIDKSKKQMITWKNRNGPNEESDSAMSIQDRQMNNPDIIHEVTIDKEYPAPSSFNPSDLEEDYSGGNFSKRINYVF